MKSKIFYIIFIIVILFLSILQIFRTAYYRLEAKIYRNFLSNTNGVFPDYVVDSLGNEINCKTIFQQGVFLIATISPKDCSPCLEAEVNFLNDIKGKIQHLPVYIIVNYHYSFSKEISQWLEEYNIQFPYFFDFSGSFEDFNHLNKAHSWNFLVRNGKIITIFLPPQGKISMKIYIEFIKDMIKKKL